MLQSAIIRDVHHSSLRCTDATSESYYVLSTLPRQLVRRDFPAPSKRLVIVHGPTDFIVGNAAPARGSTDPSRPHLLLDPRRSTPIAREERTRLR